MTWWRDFAYGCRTLIRFPGFTSVAALSLALGIAANTVIFSLINGLLLRPLDYPDPERLVWIWSVPRENPQQQGSQFAPNYFSLRDQAESFEAVGAYWGEVSGNIGAGEDGQPAEKLQGLVHRAEGR